MLIVNTFQLCVYMPVGDHCSPLTYISFAQYGGRDLVF